MFLQSSQVTLEQAKQRIEEHQKAAEQHRLARATRPAVQPSLVKRIIRRLHDER